MTARLLFNASAVVEVIVGSALLLTPAFVIGLLLGDDAGHIGSAVARVLGLALLSLGVAAWETPRQEIHLAPRVGICAYNLGVAVLLSVLGTLRSIRSKCFDGGRSHSLGDHQVELDLTLKDVVRPPCRRLDLVSHLAAAQSAPP